MPPRPHFHRGRATWHGAATARRIPGPYPAPPRLPPRDRRRDGRTHPYTLPARSREPAIAWQSAHGTLLIDRYGHVLGPATRSTLPLVSGPQPPDSDTITAVKYALRLLPAAPDGAVAGFSLDRSTGLSIHGRSGWQAVLGSGTAQNLVIRIANLQVVLNTVARNGQRLATADR